MYSYSEVKNKLSTNLICLFNEQAKRTPDAVAIIFDQQTITYKKLNERSNQLAHYLKEQGVGPETLVPVCVERGPDMVVAIFGILKAGGAYVPLDPAYPQDRIDYILEDTAATVIISTSLSRAKIFTTAAAVVELDRDWPLINNQPVNDLPHDVMPDQLAYVIYTSGSTGKPKGVMIEHRNTNSFINWCRREFTPGSFKIVYAVTSVCFDLSVFEIFFTLSVGKCIRILQSGLDIGKYINTDKGVLLNTVPGVVENMLKEGISLHNVTVINMAGEPLPPHLANSLDTSKIEVRNLYGPTEDTTYSTVYRIKNGQPVLIGKPISGKQLFIVNESNELCLSGVTGEICLAGDGLARGYLNRPELTAEKFISKSFDPAFGDRLYRTGDLGQWQPDGNIAYLGRIDDQVKILGYRIEPGEIESVLKQSGLIEQSVVLAKDDAEGIKRLVAYVTSKGKFDKAAAQAYLKTQLPVYMVPTVWVLIKELPVTLNGKIDKKALPEPGWGFHTNALYSAPTNEIEQQLIDIWKDLLQVPQIGIHDNFFDLGGYSLLAVRLISILEKKFKAGLSPRDILDYTTISALAKRINGQAAGQGTNNLKSLIPMKGGSKSPLYIVCGSGGTVFAFRDFVKMLDPDQPVFGLQQPISINELMLFPDSIPGIATKYIAEILIQNPNGPYALSGHCLGGTIAYEMAQQLKAMGKNVVLLALFETDVETTTNTVPQLSNLYKYPAKLKQAITQSWLKIDFELFLLRKHTKQALTYKLKKFKKTSEEAELKTFNYISKAFETANSNYALTPYNGDILAFYAKERYYFVDRLNNIHYKKLNYQGANNDWGKYATSVKYYEIDGEHSTIFESRNASKFAGILQDYLNRAGSNN